MRYFIKMKGLKKFGVLNVESFPNKEKQDVIVLKYDKFI